MAVKPVPEGYHTVIPYLIATDAVALIDFMTRAFGAKVHDVTKNPDGTITHADVIVGDSHVMLGQGNDKYPPSPGSIYLYVPDTDAVYRQALAAGATSLMEPADQFYGDRNAGVKDPVGNTWWIGTHVEDVSAEEIQRRMAALNRS
jgi:PhnB protein